MILSFISFVLAAAQDSNVGGGGISSSVIIAIITAMATFGGASAPDPVAMELWTKAVSSSGNCVTETASWWRWTYPKATFTLGDVSHENGIGLVQLTGTADANPNYGNGCFDDWPVTDEIDPTSPEHFTFDPDGPPTAQCGYITVPVQTS